jgi:hypothetical protein
MSFTPSLVSRALVFRDQEVNLHFGFGLWNGDGLVVLDEEYRGDAIEHQRHPKIEDFDELIEFILHRQVFDLGFRAMELNVGKAPGPQDVIVGSGVECEVERSFAFEIIFTVSELKINFHENPTRVPRHRLTLMK